MVAAASLSGMVALAEQSQCAGLAEFKIAGAQLEITSSKWLDATDTLPPRCRVDGVMNRRIGFGGIEYGITFAIALPTNWNGDFLMQGGGGLNGSVQPPLGATAAGQQSGLARGFAVASTDTGHKGATAFDAGFLRDQQAALDFAYAAIGSVAEISKRVIDRYYGRQAAHSYFAGCSTGGREGLIMTQRYPAYFDGVISGAPAMRTGFSNLADRWVAVSLSLVAPKDASGRVIAGTPALPASDRKLIVDSLLKKCDIRDGVQDGMIFDLLGCEFDPSTIACGGPKTESCLTPDQAKAVKRAFSGPTNSWGYQVYPGFLFDTGINAAKGIPGLLNPGPSPVGPRELPTQQNVDEESIAALNPLTDSTSTNLSTFIGHGGKLLLYHGASDPWFSALDTVGFYQRISKANSQQNVTDWSRLFLVPGMGHCSGGEAALDEFDMLGALVDWVEKGKLPDAVTAKGKAFPKRSRPLCPYPTFAHYTGTGNPEDAANFVCRQ